jgi:hypothetical protein
MPIPFAPEVAAYAVELLANVQIERGTASDPFEALEARFPELHPVLLAEHLGYAEELFRAAATNAALIRAGISSDEQALNNLKSSQILFNAESIERAFSCVKARA